MKNVLVTGASGFIGTALCSRLLQEEWRVAGTVSSDGSATSLPDGVEVVRWKRLENETFSEQIFCDVDVIVHLAARVHVMQERVFDPMEEFRKVNCSATERMALAAARDGVKRFVFVSTVKVNGEGGIFPYREDDEPNPHDPYGQSKWEAEQVLRAVEEKTEMEVVVLRPPLIYGPGVKGNFIRLVKSVCRGIPFPLAKVENRRSLIALDNFVDAIVCCLEHKAAAGQTYLVSDGEDVSTPDLIRRIGVAAGKKTMILPFPLWLMKLAGSIFGKGPAVERLFGSLTVDASRIKRELGWMPLLSTDAGIKKTVDWYLSKNVPCQ